MSFDHLGLVVEDLDAEMARLDAMCGPLAWSDAITDPIQKVDMRFGRATDGLVYELLRPTGADSPLAKTLKSRRNILNHICYRTEDLASARDRLARLGLRAFTEPVPAVAFGMARVQFFLHPAGWIAELVEAASSPVPRIGT